MASSTSQSNVERTQREIQTLQKSLASESKKEADTSEKIARTKQAISRTSVASIIQSKLRDIGRFEGEIVQIQKKKATLSKQISDKTAKLHSYQQQVTREQNREQQKFLNSLKQQQLTDQRKRQAGVSRVARSISAVPIGSPAAEVDVQRDAFISHASEDKDEVVRPLAEKLVAAGLSVWYDEFELTVGDSLRKSIDRGLVNSRFGIVVLSPHFFAKNWTEYELNGLVAREMADGSKVILPLWHHVSKDEVRKHSPSLADKVALNTAVSTLDEIVEQLIKAIRKVKT
jgi:hypothetical protein